MCTKVGNAIIDYSGRLIDLVDKAPDDMLTEQNAHNIGVVIF